GPQPRAGGPAAALGDRRRRAAAAGRDLDRQAAPGAAGQPALTPGATRAGRHQRSTSGGSTLLVTGLWGVGARGLAREAHHGGVGVQAGGDRPRYAFVSLAQRGEQLVAGQRWPAEEAALAGGAAQLPQVAALIRVLDPLRHHGGGELPA